MNNTFELALAAFKRDSRFKVGLTPEQSESLYESLRPIGESLENYKTKMLAIRKNSMLSDAGKNAEAEQARNEALEQIVEHAAKVDRTKIINDLAQRVNTKVNGARERAQKAFPQDAALLAAELRTTIIPRVLNEARQQQIPAHQALGKMAMRAAESYVDNMAKAEIVLQACRTGWPWVAAELKPETMQAVEAAIGAQVAGDEQQALAQAQGIQRLLDKVLQSAQQSLKELG